MNSTETFDESEVYKKRIAPLLKDIKILCMENDIPFFACFATKQDEKETHYEQETHEALSNRNLIENKIIKHVTTHNQKEEDNSELIGDLFIENNFLDNIV